MRIKLLSASVLLFGAAFVAYRNAQAMQAETAIEAGPSLLDSIAESVTDTVDTLMGWSESKIPAQYLDAIRTAEAVNGLPDNLLARLLWQESRYRPNAVNRTSGAQGIAQFMPATAKELGVDPFDAYSSIAGAGRYLAWLYGQVGDWAQALAAYNWGVGNVKRKGLAKAPSETRSYYTSIMNDIGLA